jgi:hypothetical protein
MLYYNIQYNLYPNIQYNKSKVRILIFPHISYSISQIIINAIEEEGLSFWKIWMNQCHLTEEESWISEKSERTGMLIPPAHTVLSFIVVGSPY